MLYKKHWNQSHVGQSSLMRDRAVSCGTRQSHVGHRSLIWDRVVLYGSEHYQVGQVNLMWDLAVSCRKYQSYVEERVSWWTNHYNVGQSKSSLIWNRVVLCGTRQYSVRLQSHIVQRSLRRSNITSLK